MGFVDKPVPYWVEVAALDLGTGRIQSLGRAHGQWAFMAMNCCGGYRQVPQVRWMSEAEGRRRLEAKRRGAASPTAPLQWGPDLAVVEPWSELIELPVEPPAR
jgi:hypothetical protein